MRLIDDDLRDFGVSRKAEKGIRHQPFGRDIDDFIGAAPCVIQREHILSGRKRAVEIGRAHAVLQQREDLIAHQRNERRNDEGDARQNERGNLIADRFARARGHDGHHVAPAQNRGNRVFLPRTEIVIAENLFKPLRAPLPLVSSLLLFGGYARAQPETRQEPEVPAHPAFEIRSFERMPSASRRSTDFILYRHLLTSVKCGQRISVPAPAHNRRIGR